ncbi:MAG: bifunctional phosphopantothenoylcysteine decarboxylase/phosphopantothenate--cysteine ligase CoaBC [Spirochaetes bacterium]|nr:bifunctional phosphopantothenoylcysteine decarboxylase/phosphopantothenate--cysteine ligase CoaBC [Spirochaetota bacterium]
MNNLEILKDKKIIFGISGGIAAYKAANIVSFLRRNGASVHVVMTKNAKEFITPLTLKTLSANKVIIDMFDDEGYVTHISLTEIADLFIVAPATANIIAKFANGIADDMLSTMYLAYKGPVLIIPSMNDNMYSHPATQENIKILLERKNFILEPEYGKLATGKVGKGRFPEDQKIIEKIIDILFLEKTNKDFSNKIEININENFSKKNNILVTLGATRAYIDPVRFISNPSSGKMGYYISKAFIDKGYQTYTIAATYTFSPIDKLPNLVKTESSKEMLEAILEIIKNNKIDLIIMTAAISDFKVEKFSKNKIKRENRDKLIVELEKDIDVINEIKRSYPDIKIVGFAAETEDEKINGYQKLEKKNIEAICINKVYKNRLGFEQDINSILYIDKSGQEIFIENKTKEELGKILCDLFIKNILK